MASHSGERGLLRLQLHVYRSWNRFIDVLFPPRCGGCSAPGTLWCATCRADVQPVVPPWCDKCGNPSTSGLCSTCRAEPLQIDRIRSAALFAGSLRQGIHHFKYQRLSSLKDPFGILLAECWRAQLLTADWLVPVPLHPTRERERGYNQSKLLAQTLSRQVGVPVLTRALRRTRHTAVQMRLNALERKQNVAGAFDCTDPRMRGARIIVIDDVCTTGATLDACAAALLKAGAASVMGLTLARTP